MELFRNSIDITNSSIGCCCIDLGSSKGILHHMQFNCKHNFVLISVNYYYLDTIRIRLFSMANVINCFASSNLTLFSTSIKVLVTTTLLGQKIFFSSWQPNQLRNLFLIAQMCLFTSDLLFLIHSWNIYHNL